MLFRSLIGVLVSHSKANWLHQCSQCVDQSLYSDMALKTDIRSANTSHLYDQMKQFQVREFEHVEKEFFNRFFSRSQLGLVAQEVQGLCPAAVSLIPERRYTSSNGTQVSQKNVLMVRESHILFVLLGGVQEIAKRVDLMDNDYWVRASQWDDSLTRVTKDLVLMTDKTHGLSKSVSESLLKISHISEESNTILRLVKMGEDRVMELRGSVSGLSQSLTQWSGQLRDELADLRNRQVRDQFEYAVTANEIRNDINSASTGLVHVKGSIHSLSETIDAMLRRILAVESLLFRLQAEHNAVISDRKLVDRKRVNWIKLLLELERTKRINRDSERMHTNNITKLEADLYSSTAERMASRREAFDKQLLELQEASQLRVLREKSQIDSLAAERQLKFEKEKLNVEMAIRIEEARIESEMKFRDKRENEDVNLRELNQRNSAEKDKVMALVRETSNIIASWVREVYSTPETLMIAVGSIIGLVAGIYLAKEGAQLVRQEIGRRLGKPDLVRVTSKKSWIAESIDACLCWLGLKSALSLSAAFADVVLPSDLLAQIRRLAIATRSAHANSAPLLNMMFYGPPGTGKTLVAKKFAECSGLDYAIMSGGDIAPLGAEAVTEIHKIFKWVNTSRRGVVLFIDEAESFLAQRTGGMSENLRNAITAMLFHTGTASSRFMMIIATNRPGDIDTAILDRIDERIEFPLPDFEERQRLVDMYFTKYVSACRDGTEDTLSKVAKRTKGFSGREISKLMMSVHSHLFLVNMENKGEKGPDLMTSVIMSTMEQKIKEHDRIQSMCQSGYAFDASTLDSSDASDHH